MAVVVTAFTACTIDSGYMDTIRSKMEKDADAGVSTPTYRVLYDGNGSDGGSVPDDAAEYESGATAIVLGAGTMTCTGYSYLSWNTIADGSGTSYAADDPLTVDAEDITLYAQWGLDSYALSYSGNGAEGGDVPSGGVFEYGAMVTVQGNTGGLTRGYHLFVDWNTSSGGEEAAFESDDTFSMPAHDVTLHAQWREYDLRDRGPAGGLIFFDDADDGDDDYVGWRFLEAAPAATDATGREFGGWGDNLNVRATAVGTGLDNTSALNLALEMHGESGTVVQVCHNEMDTAGYTDWFIPSRDELLLVYSVLHQNGVGGFLNDPHGYWSSSEKDNNYVYVVDFTDGTNWGQFKTSTSPRIRAVRRF